MPTFYRVVLTNPPTLWDFLSHEKRGIRLRRDTPHHFRLWEGVSVMNAESAARDLANRLPQLGSFIAAVDVSEHGPIAFEQTTPDVRHFTLWGDAADMLVRVRSVVPV
jgi:hypothetical protein